MLAQPMQHACEEPCYDTSLFSTSVDVFQLESDFYREPDMVERGVTLPLSFSAENLFQDFAEDTPFSDITVTDKGGCLTGQKIFSDLVQPSLLPEFSVTSLMLSAESPGAVAQTLHDFLAQEVGSIAKVSALKFAVKADIFQIVNGSLLNCRLKARVYRYSEVLVVDFRRRSGDAVAFQQTFTRAAQHLLGYFTAVTADEARKVPRPQPSFELPSDYLKSKGYPEEALLDPLLDMLRDVSPAGQAQKAEALAALVTVAVSSTLGAITVAAAMSREADILKACMSSCLAEVSYTAARLEAVLHEHCGQLEVCS